MGGSDIMLKRQRKNKHIILYSVHTHKKKDERDTQTDKDRHPHRQNVATKTLFCHERINLTRQHAGKLNKHTAPSLSLVGTPMFEVKEQ